MKNQWTIQDLLVSRAINGITKHSTYQDVVNAFGEPDVFDIPIMTYGCLIFIVSRVKKRVTNISIELDNESNGSTYRRYGLTFENSIYKEVIQDYSNYSMISADKLVDNLRSIGFNCIVNPLWSNHMDNIYSPVNDKPYTLSNPRFIFHVAKDTLKTEYLDIPLNYRSKF